MYSYASIPAPMELPPMQPIYLGGYPNCTTASYNTCSTATYPPCTSASYQVEPSYLHSYPPVSSYQPRPHITLPSVPHTPLPISSAGYQYHTAIKPEQELLPCNSYPTLPTQTPPVSSPSTVFHYPTPPGTPNQIPQEDPALLFARCLYQNQRYPEFQQFISTTNFPQSAVQELRDLWLDSVYQNHVNKTQKKLTPMIRYRLRKRHPLPKTIWNGEQTSYNLKQSARDYLIRYYEQNQYPTAVERRIISRDTGMEFKSVSHWFKNRRSRSKPDKSDQSAESVEELVNEVKQIADSILYA